MTKLFRLYSLKHSLKAFSVESILNILSDSIQPNLFL